MLSLTTLNPLKLLRFLKTLENYTLFR